MKEQHLFEGQLAQEEVLLTVRRHPFSLLIKAMIGVGILLIPFLLYVFLPISSTIFYALLTCILITTVYSYSSWYSWNNSFFLLTNIRIILITQKGLIHREMAGSGLEKIHRVTHQVKGLLPTFGGYGTVTILTDDTQTALTLPDVSDPFAIQQAILQAMMSEHSRDY